MATITIRQKEIQRLEKLLELYKTHSTVEELAERYGVSIFAIRSWIRNYGDFTKKSETRLSTRGLRNTQEVDEWFAVRRFNNPNFGKVRK